MVGIVWFVALFVVAMSVMTSTLGNMPVMKMTQYFFVFYIVSSIVLCVYMYHLGREHAKRLAKQAFAVTGQLQAASHEFRKLSSLFMIAGSFGARWLPITIASLIIDGMMEKDIRIGYVAQLVLLFH